MSAFGRLCLVLALCTAALAAAAEKPPAKAPEAPPCWKAGAASVQITPEKSTWMAGYGARTKPSEGVALDLFAKALAIEDQQGARVVIVTMDLIGVQASLRTWLEAQAAEKYHLPPQGLVLSASHTHCGPELPPEKYVDLNLRPGAEPAVLEFAAVLREKLLGLVGQALERLQPARLDYLYARCGFAMNRRRPTESGYQNASNSRGPVDHQVPVLRVSDADGKILALLFGYACHSTTMGDYLFRGDYPGYAQRYLEEAHPGATALFIAGCGADQNPYPRRTEEYCMAHGRSLALAVEAALDTVPKPLAGPLTAALDRATLDFVPPPSKEELEKRVAAGNRPSADNAKLLLEQLAETGRIRSTYPYPVQVIRFGRDLTMVVLAGEVVVDYSLRLKKELAGPEVWVAAYCNDVFGYVPSLRVLREGGYEAGEAQIWGALPGFFTETVEERIIDKVHQLAQ